MVDYTIPASLRLMNDFIESGLQEGLERNPISMQPPEVATLYNSNTRVLFTVLENGELHNEVAVYYDRIPITDLIPDNTTIPGENVTTIAELIPAILALTGVQLEAFDVGDGPLQTPVHTLQILDTSYGFTGSVSLLVGDGGDIGFTILRDEQENLITVGGFFLRVT